MAFLLRNMPILATVGLIFGALGLYQLDLTTTLLLFLVIVMTLD